MACVLLVSHGTFASARVWLGEAGRHDLKEEGTNGSMTSRPRALRLRKPASTHRLSTTHTQRSTAVSSRTFPPYAPTVRNPSYPSTVRNQPYAINRTTTASMANHEPHPFYFSPATELADLGRARFDRETAQITSRDHALLTPRPVAVRPGRAPQGLERAIHAWSVFQHTGLMQRASMPSAR